MPFTDTPFTVTRVDDVRWCLAGPLVYRGRHDVITVPAGFVTDFATVPWWVQSLIPRTGAWTLAAVLHDWLCVELARELQQARNTALLVDMDHMLRSEYPGVTVKWAGRGSYPAIEPAPANARDTDGLFRRVMREQHVGFVRRWLMWTGVRWGALANPARRAGWWRDAPLVAAITVLVLAVAAGVLWVLGGLSTALFLSAVAR